MPSSQTSGSPVSTKWAMRLGGLSVLVGDDVADQAAEDLVEGPAEDLLGRAVPDQDPAVAVELDVGVAGLVDDAVGALLLLLEGGDLVLQGPGQGGVLAAGGEVPGGVERPTTRIRATVPW